MKSRSITIILIVAATVFGYLATKNLRESRMSRHQKACLTNLADIEGAKEQYGIEHEGESVDYIEELIPEYLDEIPACPSGGKYTLGDLQVLVVCDVDSHVLPW